MSQSSSRATTKGVESGEFHLRDIVEAFEPCGKADSGKRRVVQGGLDVVNFHACSRHVGRCLLLGPR